MFEKKSGLQGANATNAKLKLGLDGISIGSAFAADVIALYV